MCLAIPGKISKIEEEFVTVDYSGEKRRAKILEKNLKVGDYVMVSAGFVMQKVPKEEALASIEAWKKCCQNNIS